MKVIYKKTVSEKIHEARREAIANGKEIEKIILTPLEYELLRNENSHIYKTWYLNDIQFNSFFGIKIEKETT